MEFPHINNSAFPHLNNVNVYKHANVFDYSRWQGKVSIKLCNVLWNSNYADVPGFDSEEERDTWFDSADGVSTILESGFNITPENELRIPIPYNDAYRYNYLVVDMPMQTSVENPIDYESTETRVKRWFYFIDDMTQLAPSTTELLISLDVWTTFYNTVEIPYLMLERGHAPMMQTSVDDYLANPIMNNEYLLAEDFNYGNDTVIQTSDYRPIGNGVKYVLFCAPYEPADFAQFDTQAFSGNSTPPSYSDVNVRWGHQMQVNDFAWNYGDVDYSNAKLPIKNKIQTGILNGCECFAIEGIQAQEFFNDCAKNCVNFIHGIKAMFILDEALFDILETFTFRGKQIHVAMRKVNTQNFTFQKGYFGFESKYREITKLYTSPYSTLEITDDNGNVFAAKIEQCGNIAMREEVSLVYPFLNYNVLFTNINGLGQLPYIWKSVRGGDTEKHTWASDFSKYMMNWSVPTYEIYVSAENEFAANNAAEIKNDRERAIKDYKNAVRYGNTTYENTVDSMATYETSGHNTNATNNSNTKNMATVSKNNEYRNANNIVTNQGVQNQANSDITLENTTKNDAIRTLNNIAANDAVLANNTKIYADVAQDNALSYTTSVQIENAAIAATTAANSGNAMAQGVINAVDSLAGAIGAGMSGNVGGAVVGGIGTATSLISTGFNVANANAVSSIQIGVNVDTVAATQNANNNKAANAANCNLAHTRISNALTADTNNEVNDALTNNTNTQNTASLTQTTNTSNVMKNNADAIKTQTDTNADAFKTTSDANITRFKNTENNNASWNRSAIVAASKANLEQAQKDAEAKYKNARLQRPYEQGAYSGDMFPDAYMRRGIRFNIRTQTKSAIAQAGDAMLRFGYALHRVWDMSNGLHYGKKFTFWKAEDIWINEGSGLAGNAVNIIGDIFRKGVTVWRNPDEIGRVSIYDNI